MQHLEGSGTPVLYIGRTVLKGLSLEWRRAIFVHHPYTHNPPYMWPNTTSPEY